MGAHPADAPTVGAADGAGDAPSGNRESPPQPLPGVTARAWQEESLARAAEILTLANWLNRLPPEKREHIGVGADQALDAAIRWHVAEAQCAARDGKRIRPSGARVARAAAHLDAAEADLLRRVPLEFVRGQLPSLHAHIRRHLPRDDPRRLRVEKLARDPRDDLAEVHRENLIAAVRAASSAAEREQQRVRSFCTIVYGAAAGLTALASAVALVAAVDPRALALCFQPQPGAEENARLVCPTGQDLLRGRDVDVVIGETVRSLDVPLVMFIGMVAAGVTGSIALRHIRGTATPFGVPVALAVLKLPTGALSAVLGLLLMRGGFVPGLTALDTTPQIIGWAVLFGASQQLLTGLVDRQAQQVLDSVGNKTYTPSGGS
ncbi:hypothetical protein [Geodermatophilus normandii]|uniref:hypothetical protein n=1 Tax=Geodermatophilus normandii TaxID=1137989 RepID=UPI0014750565|nr:hypothetical protein [Geodermatophilus normandii]